MSFPRWPAVAALLLATAGLALSVSLTRLHVQTHTDPTYHSFCALGEHVNCETVAASHWSLFLGLPVAVWGLFGYGAALLLAAWGLLRRRPGSAAGSRAWKPRLDGSGQVEYDGRESGVGGAPRLPRR